MFAMSRVQLSRAARDPVRGGIVRKGMLLAGVAALLSASAGCSTVVAGRAVLAEPKMGQPVAWGPCRAAGGGGESLTVPAGAQCGEIAVPISYDDPGVARVPIPLERDRETSVLACVEFHKHDWLLPGFGHLIRGDGNT